MTIQQRWYDGHRVTWYEGLETLLYGLYRDSQAKWWRKQVKTCAPRCVREGRAISLRTIRLR